MTKQNKTQLEKCFDTYTRLLYSCSSKEIEILSKVLRSQTKKLTEEEIKTLDQETEKIAKKYY